MNILILSWRGPGHPHAGGAEIVTQEYAKAWVSSGHQVTLFTSRVNNMAKEEIIDGVKIIRLGGTILGCKIEAFLWYIFGKHQDFDIVFDHFHGIPFFTPLYIRKRKIAFVHEIAKEVWKLNPWPEPFHMIPALLGPAIEPLIYKLYSKVPFWTVSDSTRRDLISFGIPNKNITIIRNGVNTINIQPIKKEKVTTITYLGALTRDKGIGLALDAFKIIDAQMEDCQFWIIGKSEERYLKMLQEKCQQLNLQHKIVFWGFVSQSEKFKLLAKSHVLVNPSSYEGWGLVVIEGASVGTPTVGFNVAGLRDSIINQKTGILCQENTAQDLARNVLLLLKDSAKYRKICLNALRWSKTFTWGNSIKESLNQLERTN